MNWLFKLLHPEQWLELEQRKLEPKPCEACDAYRLQVAHLIEENKLLLRKIIEPAKEESPLVTQEPPKPILRGVKPWRVKQQMLERQTRIKREQKQADDQALSEAANVAPVGKTEELEKELGIA